MQNDLIVHKGIGLKKMSKQSGGKHIIFDLDETLGSFSDLYILYQCLNETTCDTTLDASTMVKQLLLLYPEFLRCGITVILQFLYYKKKSRLCDGVHIYTNNQCIPDSWTYFVLEYIEEQHSMSGLFGDVIRSFKIDGKIVEPRRSEQNKSIRDLLKCIIIPPHTEICYVDDAMHPKMKHRYLYYLQPKPYYHGLSKKEIIERYLNNTNHEMSERMYQWYHAKGYVLETSKNAVSNLESDIEVSKKLMYHIREFFLYKSKCAKTRRHRKSAFTRTKRLRHNIVHEL